MPTVAGHSSHIRRAACVWQAGSRMGRAIYIISGVAKANVSRRALVEAMAALESQRDTSDQAFARAVETALAALRDKLADLQTNPGDQQQRQLVVLVADLSGFTALSERMDVEKVRDALNAMWGVLDAVIAAFGGRIDQHAGDSLVALFGLPQPRRGDAARALGAALTMQTELALFNRRVRQAAASGEAAPWVSDWPGPGMRIGVHSGPVYFTRAASGGRLTATGETLAVARRLERAAPPSQVLASASVMRQTQARFQMSPPPEATARRMMGEETYVVSGERPDSTLFTPGQIAGQTTRLIGRTEEMDRLELALQATIDSGAPQVATLIGAAGAGKSRLIREFEGRARLLTGDLTILHAATPAASPDIPFALVRDLLLRQFDIRPQYSRYVIEDRLDRALDRLDRPERVRRLSATGPLAGTLTLLHQLLDVRAAATLTVEQVRDVVERLLGALTHDRPAIVVLEGLHRADRHSLALVDHLVREVTSLPVLFLGVAVTDPHVADIPWLGLGDDPFSPTTTIEVGPLSAVDSRLMATEILSPLPPPMRLLDLVVAESGGNPLYIEAFARLLMDSGVIAVGERWRVDMAHLESMRLPAGLARLVEARLASLPELERTLLQAAAVAGGLFWDAVLLDTRPVLMDDATEAEIEAALANLEAQRYIVRNATYSFGATQAYLFRREVVQETAYQGLPQAEREAQHLQVAQWLIAGRNDTRFAAWFPVEAMIARHFAAAGEAAQAEIWGRRAALPLPAVV